MRVEYIDTTIIQSENSEWTFSHFADEIVHKYDNNKRNAAPLLNIFVSVERHYEYYIFKLFRQFCYCFL